MTTDNIVKTFKKYRGTSSKNRKRQEYLQTFEEKMLYRTTKTENPQTTKGMVRAILDKLR